jgi:serine/threonine-protein kinase OSR1/STK39
LQAEILVLDVFLDHVGHAKCHAVQVYKAVVRHSGEVVAVKLIDLETYHENLVRNRQELQHHLVSSSKLHGFSELMGFWQELVMREASLMKRQRHLNILELYTAFVSDHYLWMVVPFVSGGSLETLLKRGYPKVAIGCFCCKRCLNKGVPASCQRPHISVGTIFLQGLREVEIATIMKQVLKGIAYLHSRGVIHRDIKV